MKTRIFLFSSVLLAMLIAIPLHGQVRLPRLISDGMVLQRDTYLKIWGWAAPGEAVTVEFTGKSYATRADESGNWKVTLPPISAGGPHTMVIRAGNTVTLSDIMIGDVWLCSGQSNMELPVRRVRPLYEAEIAAAENKNIRSFIVPKVYSFKKPLDDLSAGGWVAANPETVLDFSAAAWFFAVHLNKTYGVPVGLLTSAFGGSPAEAWISEESLKEFPVHYNELQKCKSDSLMSAIAAADQKRIQEWYRQLGKADEAYKSTGLKWYDPEMPVHDWKTITIPGLWSGTELKGINGVVWFRREITVPASAAGKPASINLGRIIDADSAFLNGIFIGTVSYQYPPRRYTVPAGVLKDGSNILTVRVISNIGDGGFVTDKPYDLVAGDFHTSLEGEWRYRVGAVMPPLRGQTFFGYKPGGLFNGMLAPLLDYRLKGILWYQGESNAGRPDEYRHLLPALIKDWRKNLGQGDLPFIVVQLPNFMEAKDEPSESSWAMFREAQTEALRLPATGMAVTIDIGEWNDIHPLNKKDVGTRMALVAQKVAYSDNEVVWSGPTYKSMTVKRGKIILSFDHPGSGLVAKGGGELQQFAIAGADMKFIWAKAKIRGDRVIVKGENLKHPVAVRYAWADNPAGANLCNREGLPAAPFRTDNRQ
ncbi:MAG: sialate O-acetylesterase [Bacteroidales bacterium]